MNWKDRFLFVSIPLKTQTIHYTTSLSLSRLQARIKDGGGNLLIDYQPTGGIVLARNRGMSRALATPMTDFLFLDADISFYPEAVEGLLDSGLGFVAGAYSARGTDWEVLYQRIRAGQIQSAEDAATLSAQLLIRIPEGPFVVHNDRYVQASHVATGFLHLSRLALENLASESKIIKRVNYATKELERVYHICEFGLRPDHQAGENLHEFVGEDFFLCEKYREQCGGKVWIDSECKLDHAGETIFSTMSIAQMAERDLL